MSTTKTNTDFWFDSTKEESDLKSKSIKGGLSTTASQFLSFGLNMVATFVLARILFPEDFGLVGMVTAFTGLAGIIKDMGLSVAVIQKEKITPGEVTNLFWINILICFVLGALFIIFSPLIVALYHDTRLYPIIISYAAGIFISGFAIQHTALMSRKMLFTGIAKANVYSSALSVACGIVAAVLHLGYWAIVIQNLSLIFFNTVFIWMMCNWRPGLPVKRQPIRSFVRFGAGLSGFNIINYFARYSDDVIIGSSIGAVAVGFYTKAYQLLMLPINQLRNPLMTVAIPAMSKLQSEPQRYVNYYKKYVFILAFFSMPLVACLAIFSDELILFVLGPQWLESSRIFVVLAIAGFIHPVSSSSGLIMISSGQTRKFFIIGCISSAVTVLGFFIGIRWGVIGTAVSLIITTYLLLIPVLYYAFKTTPVKMHDFFSEVSLPITHTAGFCAIIYVSKVVLTGWLPNLLVFFVVSPCAFILYYYSWKMYAQGRRKLESIDEILETIRARFRKKTSQPGLVN